MEASAAHAIKVDTAVSPLDTEIAVFGTCPTHGEAPLSTSDDAFGLAAAAVLEPSAQRKAYWLLVRNIGARGEVGIVADETGTISGTVSWVATSSYPASAQVDAINSSGFYTSGAQTSASGEYELAVAPGTYYVAASASGNLPKLWPDVECGSFYAQNCVGSPAQMLTVANTDFITGIDFSLNQGARISGRVRDAETGLAIANVNIQAVPVHPVDFTLPTTQSDGAGRFTLDGLAAGDYHVLATSNRYLVQAFDGVDCPTGQSCGGNTGAAITLAQQGTFDHADFNLHPAAFLRVVVNAAGTTPWDFANVTAFDSAGTQLPIGYAAIGQATDLGPLVPGSYRFAVSLRNHVSQLYDHVDCATDCVNESAAAGRPLQVSTGTTEPTAAFDLRALANVSGRIADRSTGQGLGGVALMLWPTTGGFLQFSIFTMDDGTYTFTGVPPGTYWLRASSADHHDLVYANAPCSDNWPGFTSGCQLTAATPIAVGAVDLAGIDMTLPLNGSIAGRVGDASLTSPTPAWASISLYDSIGTQLRYAAADASGQYIFNDLPAGTYFVQAIDASSFSQIYSGIDCPSVGTACDPSVGTSITLAQGTQRTNIDFSLIHARRLVGRVVDAVSGQGVPGVVVDAWDTQGGAHCDDASTDLDGYYAIDDSGPCTSDSRWLSTDAGTGHVDQVFSGIACPNGPAYLGQCALTGATAVAFPTTPALSRADFSLTRPDPIFANGFEAASVLRSARTKR